MRNDSVYFGELREKLEKVAAAGSTERLADRQTECIESGDMQGLNDLLYEDFRWSALPYSSGGYDHCMRFYDCLTALACGDYEAIERCLPRELDESANGYPFYVNGTNLLMGLLFEDDGLLRRAVPKAEKFATSKKPQYERMVIRFMLALYENDGEGMAESLQAVCDSYPKTDFAKHRNPLCIGALGLLGLWVRLSHNEQGSDERAAAGSSGIGDTMRLPTHKCFPTEYAQWRLQSPTPTLSLYYVYPEDLDIIPKLLSTPPAVSRLHQPYIDSDNTFMSARDKKKSLLDTDRMRAELLEEVYG